MMSGSLTHHFLTVSQSTDQLKLIDVRKPLMRALLLACVALALLFSWYAIRWYVGDFVSEFAPQMGDEQLNTALAAMRLAPDDPWTHWMVANLKKRSFLPEDLNEAVHQYEEAVRLSPYDYRFWVDLGRAREESGDVAGGEMAFRRAVELAPAYAYPRWYLGNLLLRAGHGEEAFAELRRAADADPQLRPQLFNAAGAFYGEDIDSIRKAVGDTPPVRAEFATYLVGRGRLDDAQKLWASLSQEEKKEQSSAGNALMKGLLAQKRYRAAMSVFSELKSGIDSKGARILNGDFEDDVSAQAEMPFNWQVKNDPQAHIAIDESTRHGGKRSLRILFRAPKTLAFSNVSQLVTVEPATSYQLEYYVRAEDLKSAETLVVVILDAVDGTTVLGASHPLAPGTYDWQSATIKFKTPPKTEAIVVRIDRVSCGGETVCPIFGTVWYDDFNLQAISGAPGPRDSREGKKPGA